MKIKIVILLVLIACVIYFGKYYLDKNNQGEKGEKVLSIENQIKKIGEDVLNSGPVKQIGKDSQKSAEDILGAATKAISDAVSSTTQKAEDKIIQTSVNTVMDQVNKLPEREREEIKKQICK